MIAILQDGEISACASASLIGWPLASCNWNLSGSVLPDLTVDFGSGDEKPPNT